MGMKGGPMGMKGGRPVGMKESAKFGAKSAEYILQVTLPVNLPVGTGYCHTVLPYTTIQYCTVLGL